MHNEQPAWGTYAPPAQSAWIRLLISLGLGRGKLRKHFILSWKKKFGSSVDREVRGIRYRLMLDNNVTDGQILASSVVYDKQELEALSGAARGNWFVDVGANIGYYSLYYAKHTQNRVMAIEPNPPTLERLRFNIAANGLDERITVVPLGVGEEGEFELYSTGDLGSASLLDNPDADTRSVTIRTRPLLEMLQEAGVEKVDALKIDVEGMEDRALVPFLQTAPEALLPRCIVLEHGQEHLWEQDLFAVLKEKGYTVTAKPRGNTILNKPR